MHSSRMRTARCSGHLSSDERPPAMHTPCHANPLPCTPPAIHTPCQACPLPCMPPAMHAPTIHGTSSHAHPTPLPWMSPSCMPPTMHAPCHAPSSHAHTPPCMPPLHRQRDTCKNMTFANFVCGR